MQYQTEMKAWQKRDNDSKLLLGIAENRLEGEQQRNAKRQRVEIVSDDSTKLMWMNDRHEKDTEDLLSLKSEIAVLRRELLAAQLMAK